MKYLVHELLHFVKANGGSPAEVLDLAKHDYLTLDGGTL